MNKEKFNKYCAEVMGYEIDTSFPELFVYFHNESMARLFNPYWDLNQLADVVEKLILEVVSRKFDLDNELLNIYRFYKNIKQAFRDFVISTME